MKISPFHRKYRDEIENSSTEIFECIRDIASSHKLKTEEVLDILEKREDFQGVKEWFEYDEDVRVPKYTIIREEKSPEGKIRTKNIGILFDTKEEAKIYAEKDPGLRVKKIFILTKKRVPAIGAELKTDFIDLNYLLEQEKRGRPDPNYMKNIQKYISSRQRGMLVNWFMMIAQQHVLRLNTLFLAVSLLDRFLSQRIISLPQLQLVGVGCLMIASKFEEIYPPLVADWIWGAPHITKEQLLKIESLILNQLNWEISGPTTFYFLIYFLNKIGIKGGIIYDWAVYIATSTLLMYRLIRYLPSDTALACLSLILQSSSGDKVLLVGFIDLLKTYQLGDKYKEIAREIKKEFFNIQFGGLDRYFPLISKDKEKIKDLLKS